MSLLSLTQVCLRYSEHALLDQVSFRLHNRDKVALMGRNGAGKSTLMKLMAGEVEPDSGSVERLSDKIGMMPQTIPGDLTGTIADYVQSEYRVFDPAWQDFHRVSKVISQLELDADQPLAELSGGQVRRCLLAAALVNEPEILLLDEPTNHLDIASIEWLERFLQRAPMAVVVISHDRAFLQAVCHRFMELERGQITDWSGRYEDFVRHREHLLAAEVKSRAEFDKKLAQEEVWIRQGIKARRTRNEGRVRALQQLRHQYADRRQRQGDMSLTQQAVQYSGKQVLQAQDLGYQYGDKNLFQGFSCLLQRQDKVGILGANGCGKTTLIQCLLGEVKPTSGVVKVGTQLHVAYSDQHRQQLNMHATPVDIVGQGRQAVTVNGKEKHVISYLQDFLFTPQQARAPISKLSGGECNRLLLAKLFSQPANFMVLDEPTNDLDIESLELLEEYLLNFEGTLLLISHDRALLNNVVTRSWYFEEDGTINDYVGGYDDVMRQRTSASVVQANQPKKVSPKVKQASRSGLSYEERRELPRLPDQIDKTEAAISALHQQMAADGFYQQSRDQIDTLQAQLQQLEQKLQLLYQRWEELMIKDSGS